MDHVESSWPLFKASSLSVVIWNCLFIKSHFCFPLHIRLGISWKVGTLSGSSHSSFIRDNWQRLSNNMILAANNADFCPRCTQYHNNLFYLLFFFIICMYIQKYTYTHPLAEYVCKKQCNETYSCAHMYACSACFRFLATESKSLLLGKTKIKTQYRLQGNFQHFSFTEPSNCIYLGLKLPNQNGKHYWTRGISQLFLHHQSFIPNI